MLATRKQIDYLQHLTDRAEYIKKRVPGMIPCGLYHRKWDCDMTSSLASSRIAYYCNILDSVDKSLYSRKKVSENEDLPV